MSRHLMARFRHLHAADGHGLSFDWKPHDSFPLHHYAPLENGDQLWVTGEKGRERPGLTATCCLAEPPRCPTRTP